MTHTYGTEIVNLPSVNSVLCQRAYKNYHFHTKILIQIGNELTREIPRKIGQDLIVRSCDTNFAVGSRGFRQSLSKNSSLHPYEAYIHM